jgi:choline dehydrogenase
MEEYDYVVVGAGTAGCAVAARLCEDSAAQVLLIEAGRPDRTRGMTVPNAWPENLGTDADWANVTTAQADAGPVSYPRGRAVGGSGAINGMAHVRGHMAVYDAWAAGGATGWSFAELLPYFRRSERTEGRDPELRGTSGAIPVAPAAREQRHRIAREFVAALAAVGHPRTDDLSGRHQEGTAWVDLAISAGARVSSAEAYLSPALDRPNLHVATNCLVIQLQIQRGHCTGLTYLRDGMPVQVRASGEVILCAGAVGSPQLLMLSGIGPAEQLRVLGIKSVADIAGVGQHLQDHPIVLVSHGSAESLPASSYNHGEAYAALRSEYAGAWPDLHLFPILFPLAPPGHQPPASGYALVGSAVAPDSVGEIRLASADPTAAPLIDPGFLRTGHDLDRLVGAVRFIREAAATAEFPHARNTEVWPGPDVDTIPELRRYIRRTVGSYYHPTGTCRLGTDVGAVVDADLRVQGVAGLRVADASVMPAIPNAHPNATVLAIAERAADLVKCK